MQYCDCLPESCIAQMYVVSGQWWGSLRVHAVENKNKNNIFTKTSLLKSWFKYAIILPFIVIGDLWTPKTEHCKI